MSLNFGWECDGSREIVKHQSNHFVGRVGEWLKPADCKSAAPCGLRRFESSPVHQRLSEFAGLVPMIGLRLMGERPV
jgi:hypothetical protein